MSPLLYYALPALSSYVMLSIFFLRRPRLLHTPWVSAFCLRLGAHRGGELGWGRQGVGTPEDGVRIARQVPGWTAERGRSKGQDVKGGQSSRWAESRVAGQDVEQGRRGCSTWPAWG